VIIYPDSSQREFYTKFGLDLEETKGLLDFTGDVELKKWILKESSLPYIKLAKEIQDAGLPVEVFKPLINSIKNSNSKEDNKSMEEYCDIIVIL